jgi:ethanolaminephosphotransferase
MLGVDACNTALEVLIFAGATNLGQTWATLLALFGSVFTFYVQTWDEYHTHTLTLGIISGPVEGILTLCLVYLFTAIKGGGSYWHNPLLPTIGLPKLPFMSDAVYNMPFTHWYIAYGGVMVAFATLSSIGHVMRVRRQRGQSVYEPLLGLAPAALSWILIAAYAGLQPEIRENHLVPFALFIGLVNAYSVGQMIVAHLVKSSFPYGNVLLIPLAAAVMDSLAPKLGLWQSLLGSGEYHVAFVFTCLGLGVGVYGGWVVSSLPLRFPADIC